MDKPDAATLALFAAAIPDDARVERRSMFGMPSAFVGGHMFFGTFSDRVCAKVPDTLRDAMIASGDAEPFEPMPGRPWRDYVSVPAAGATLDRVQALARAALDHTAALPAKVPKARAPKAAR